MDQKVSFQFFWNDIKKTRKSVGFTQSLDISPKKLLNQNNSVEAELPNPDLYYFFGKFKSFEGNEEKTATLSIDNVLWSNSIISGSDIIGLILYTGKDTRLEMNRSLARPNKEGVFEKDFKRVILYLCLVFGVPSLWLGYILVRRYIILIYAVRFFILIASVTIFSLNFSMEISK